MAKCLELYRDSPALGHQEPKQVHYEWPWSVKTILVMLSCLSLLYVPGRGMDQFSLKFIIQPHLPTKSLGELLLGAFDRFNRTMPLHRASCRTHSGFY